MTAVAITGLAAMTAFGRGAEHLMAAAWSGRAAFAPVTRFDVAGRRVRVAATSPVTDGSGAALRVELVAAIATAARHAGLTSAELGATPLILAVHGDPDQSRPGHQSPEQARAGHQSPEQARAGHRSPEQVGAGPIPRQRGRQASGGAACFAAEVASAAGLGRVLRTYTSACVAASTAVAAAAAMISRPDVGEQRVIVAAGYLVEPDQFALFDGARVLAADARVRPFSIGRTGLLLGDGVAAMVLESAESADRRGTAARARLHGWARTGDAYHVCRPRPDGAGLARAIDTALARARISAGQVGYVNAHGSGSPHSDRAEAAALATAGVTAPVSSTKSVHGQALEASGLVELVATVQSLRHGRLPVNSGYLGPDADCPIDLVTRPRETTTRYALSLNAAFGGANTALLVGAP